MQNQSSSCCPSTTQAPTSGSCCPSKQAAVAEPTPKIQIAPDAQRHASTPDLDSVVFRKHYVTAKDGVSEITLLMKGIRCAACVNQNETAIEALEGVEEFRINYSNHRGILRWDADKLSLQTVMDVIQSLGYDATPHCTTSHESDLDSQRQSDYIRLVVAVFCSMNLMWIAIAQYAGYFSGISQRATDLFNLAGFILATPVLFYAGQPFFKGALAGMRNRMLSMDFQIAASTSIIYLYSIYAAISRSGETYFEAVAMFIMFISIGKYLELIATQRITEISRHLKTLLPFAATRIVDGKRETVELDQIETGWILETQPGERIVADGKVLNGTSSVDESHLTGESLPVIKTQGAEVSSGSINLEGVLRYEVVRPVQESTISRIINLVEDALGRKPRTRLLADSLTKYFVTFMTVIASAVFAYELLYAGGLEVAIVHAVSVLIIACPCALSLATPIAVLTGISTATEQKILFRSGTQFETLCNITDVVLDKTGTLTEGNPAVNEHRSALDAPLVLAQALTQNSRHPISKAVERYCAQQETSTGDLPDLQDFQEIPGQGVRALWNDKTVLGGNPAFLLEQGVTFSEAQQQDLQRFRSQCQTLFLLALDGELVETYAISDPLRQESAETVQHLQSLGLRVHLLTGDHQTVAEKVAQRCGIPMTLVRASVQPEQKQAYVEQMHQEERVVIMVGDGINDAPSLAKADIGIAMGTSADKALEISDIVLLSNDLRAIPQAMQIARGTFRLVRQNMKLSLVYNLIAIPLAVVGWVIPLIAALSMSFSSLMVVLNSLRARHGLRQKLKQSKSTAAPRPATQRPRAI